MAGREKGRQNKKQKGKRSLNNKNRHPGKNRPEKTRKEKHSTGLPSKEDLRQFIQDSANPLNKREIARAFGIKGQDRMLLRKMLRELAEEGGVEKNAGKSYKAPDALPERALIEITGLDGDGELRAKPVEWFGKGPVPIIYVIDKKRSEGYANPGDKILARLKRIDKHEYEARILKSLAEPDTARNISSRRNMSATAPMATSSSPSPCNHRKSTRARKTPPAS
jgi:ribonuclease R